MAETKLKEFAENAKKEGEGEEKIYLVPVAYEVYGRVAVKAVSPRAAYERNPHAVSVPTKSSVGKCGLRSIG